MGVIRMPEELTYAFRGALAHHRLLHVVARLLHVVAATVLGIGPYTCERLAQGFVTVVS